MLATIADMISIATFQNPVKRQTPVTPDRKESLRRMRADLPDLNAHLLRDIGLDPDDHGEDQTTPIWRWSPR
ncbi:MAG: DUF1127 domain-containing protein [Albidovulum sp.]|uniref:DUF1127 domain-containing protein n=1 Tax=Albidovulum sp. TaxID=1872424 RepID=UPI003C8957BA